MFATAFSTTSFMTEAHRKAPFAPSLPAILAISRVSNLPTVWMNVVAAIVLTGVKPGVAVVGLLATSLSAFYCGGMTLNDLCDREVDAREQPFRPIPSGRISVRTAQTLMAVLFAAGLSLLLVAPRPSAFWPGLALLALIIAYDRIHKRAPWSVVLMAGTRWMVFVVSAWAVTGGVPGIVALAGAAQFGYTLLVTVVARLENARGRRFPYPVIPTMIAAMSIVDGAILAAVVAPGWLALGCGAAVLTHLGQRYIRGD